MLSLRIIMVKPGHFFEESEAQKMLSKFSISGHHEWFRDHQKARNILRKLGFFNIPKRLQTTSPKRGAGHNPHAKWRVDNPGLR